MLKYNKDKPYQKYSNGIKNFRQIAFYNDEEENATDQKTSESSQSLGATKPTRYLQTVNMPRGQMNLTVMRSGSKTRSLHNDLPYEPKGNLR